MSPQSRCPVWLSEGTWSPFSRRRILQLPICEGALGRGALAAGPGVAGRPVGTESWGGTTRGQHPHRHQY